MLDNKAIAVPGLTVNNPIEYFIDATAARKAIIISRNRNNANEIAKIKAEYHKLKEED